MKVWQVVVFIFLLTAVVLLLGCNPYLTPRPQSSYNYGDMDGYDVRNGGYWFTGSDGRCYWQPIDERR